MLVEAERAHRCWLIPQVVLPDFQRRDEGDVRPLDRGQRRVVPRTELRRRVGDDIDAGLHRGEQPLGVRRMSERRLTLAMGFVDGGANRVIG